MAKRMAKKLTRPILLWFYGRHDSGKTTTMRKMAELLRMGCKKFVEHHSGSDRMVVCQYGNYRIGINTQGDGSNEVVRGLERFLRMNLDICVVCARPKYAKWQNSVIKGLSTNSRQKLIGYEIMEIPRWIVGSRSDSILHYKNCAILSMSAEDLFYLIVRLMKSGAPKKWPEPSSCMCEYSWNLSEKRRW